MYYNPIQTEELKEKWDLTNIRNFWILSETTCFGQNEILVRLKKERRYFIIFKRDSKNNVKVKYFDNWMREK